MAKKLTALMLAQLVMISLLVLQPSVMSFGTRSTSRLKTTQSLSVLFAEEAAPDDAVKDSSSGVFVEESPPLPVNLVIADSEGFLNAAGSFLVESFWLGSDHHLLNENMELTDDARMNLIIEQAADLNDKYGERLGRRLAQACVVGALDEESKELIGLATLNEAFLINNDVLESEKSEAIAKNAVAALGPKQRRNYKGASMTKIAEELLSPDTKAVCVLSNLAVSRTARRMGVARALCNELELLSRDWGYSELHLLVECKNAAARTLYANKLGYKEVTTKEDAPALRLDFETGTFMEAKQDTLIMAKTP